MIKKIIKRVLGSFGFRIIRSTGTLDKNPRLNERPVGRMDSLLEDLRYRGLNCKTILDVGANHADWSRIAQGVFPGASFYLIEPQIEMEPLLKKFCGESPNSSYFLAGAGAEEGKLVLTVWDNLSGSSFLPAPENKLLESGKQREIEIITIDSIIENSSMQVPELIKLDIQGFELEALKGARKTFGTTEVYILEVSLFQFHETQGSPVFSDVISFMLERGYVVYDFPGFCRRPMDGALGQCDICFVKEDGFLRESTSWN